ncbi:flagellar hook-length control protein FliK [Acidovorax sp. FJL06]|uniref:flagellar hook-length control protein FliK n=1 Tax=Acidovorax sp. FJL06 TaxID=2153365 RepID=UPI001F44D373|nr:flagellar hook-length control protein FliK [Acidovorax sp. FJL06]
MEQAKISSSQGGTQAAHATRAKAPAQQAADAGDAASAGGFLALLAALDAASVDAGPLELAGADASPADIAVDAGKGDVDAAAMAAWQGLFASTQGDASTTGLVRQADGTLRPESMAGGVLGGAGAVAGAMGEPALNGLAMKGGQPQGLVAETAKLDASADFKDLKDGPAQGTVAGFGRIFSRMQSAQAQRVGGAAGADLSTGGGTAGDSAQRLSAAHGAAAALVQAASERPALGLSAAGAALERGAGAQAAPTGGELGPALADGVLAGLASARGAEPSAGGRSGEGPAGGGAWSESGAGTSALDGGNTDAATAFVDPGSVGTEEQVADQVAYWVNQKTQNAELTLNRDGQPVEVSVSLSGNEAHVSFRSDQAQTRELLDQSMAQLRDLLRNEGLVLSGMSVGSSAGRDAAQGQGGDAGSSRGREGARQAQVVSSAPVGTASLARGSGGADRAVDIFV